MGYSEKRATSTVATREENSLRPSEQPHPVDRQTVDKPIHRSIHPKTIQYRATRPVLDELKRIRDEKHFRSINDTIAHLIAQQSSSDYASPPSILKLLDSSVPAIISGLPGAGKTTYARDGLVPSLTPPVLVLDPHDEYFLLMKIGLGDFFALDFAQESRKLRLVPSSNVDVCKSEADACFRHLVMFQKQLKNWVIIIEEGHRFADSPFLRSFLAEARKHTRKVLVVCHQPEPFRGLGEIFKVTRP